MNLQQNTVTFISDRANGIKREYKIENGTICIAFPIGMKTLILRFEQK